MTAKNPHEDDLSMAKEKVTAEDESRTRAPWDVNSMKLDASAYRVVETTDHFRIIETNQRPSESLTRIVSALNEDNGG